MWEEMDTAAKLHKLVSGDPKMRCRLRQVFAMATIGGATGFAHGGSRSALSRSGKLADIAIVDLDSGLHQTPLYNVYSHLVYATKAARMCSTVIIHGRCRHARTAVC